MQTAATVWCSSKYAKLLAAAPCCISSGFVDWPSADVDEALLTLSHWSMLNRRILCLMERRKHDPRLCCSCTTTQNESSRPPFSCWTAGRAAQKLMPCHSPSCSALSSAARADQAVVWLSVASMVAQVNVWLTAATAFRCNLQLLDACHKDIETFLPRFKEKLWLMQIWNDSQRHQATMWLHLASQVLKSASNKAAVAQTYSDTPRLFH